MSLPKVQLVVETDRYGNPHGSGHIRLLRPFSSEKIKNNFEIVVDSSCVVEGVDIVVLERAWKASCNLSEAHQLISSIRKNKSKLIYTLDDNLIDLHRGQSWQPYSSDEKRNIVRLFVREADAVVVSTLPLKERLGRLNKRSYVVPNALDESLFFPDCIPRLNVLDNRRQDSRLIFGYMGTHSHLDDLLLILEPLRSILQEYADKLEFQMVGISSDSRVLDNFNSLPFRSLDTNGHHFYDDFVPWAKENLKWDFGIAPLAETNFNRSKSDIKFLDYAILGIPGIYSRVDAYKDTVHDSVTGILCDNTVDDWRNGLLKLIDSAELRTSIRENAFETVIKSRIISSAPYGWLQVLNSELL